MIYNVFQRPSTDAKPASAAANMGNAAVPVKSPFKRATVRVPFKPLVEKGNYHIRRFAGGDHAIRLEVVVSIVCI